MSRRPRPYSVGLWLAAGLLVTAAVVARLLYIWGPPYDGDERYVVLHALKFGSGDFNPRHFDWPASPLYYLTFALYGCQFVGGYLLGVYPDGRTFAAGALTQPEAYYVVPRLVSTAFGLATAWVLWGGVRTWLGAGPAALAALYVLVAPAHIRMSRTGLADVPMTFFLTLTLLLSLDLVRHRCAERRDFLRGGAWVGLATAMKYPGVLGSICLAAAFAATRSVSRFSWLLLAAVCSVATFFVVTPFALLDYRLFVADLAFMTGHFDSGGAATSLAARLNRVGALTSSAVGFPLLAVALVATGFALRRWRAYVAAWTVVAPLALVFAMALAITRESFSRYALPLVPPCALLAAIGWHALSHGRTSARFSWAFGLGTAVAIAVALLPSLREAQLASRPTTESAVAEWVLAHTSGSDGVAMDELGLILPTDPAIRREISEARALSLAGREDYWRSMADLLAGVTTVPRRDIQVIYYVDSVDGLIEELIRAGVRFYICNESIAAMSSGSSGGRRAAERARHYAELRARGRVEVSFDSRDGSLQGPAFTIYRLPPRDDTRPAKPS